MKVMKFGGGCLKDGSHFRRVTDVILSEREKSAVVVSAVSGVTDALIEAIRLAAASERHVPPILRDLRDRHRSVAEGVFKNPAQLTAALAAVETKLKKLERLLYGISYTEEVTPSVRAHILSYGERLATIVLAWMIRDGGRESVPLEADRIGIVTDESFDNATALAAETKRNLVRHVAPLIRRGVIPVITGFFGCTKKGKITTFGRNGSDYSAAVVASALAASVLEIWKDVDGFMSADPKIVPEAKSVRQLSYYEAAELSYFGAKILYPRTVEPLIEKNIPLRIKNLFDPARPGTIVRTGTVERKDIIKSITYNRKISVLRIFGPGVGYKPGILADVGRVLAAMGINIYSVITSQTCINLLLDRIDSERSYEALKARVGGVIEKIVREDDIALIGVVGQGLSKRQGVAAKVFSAVAREKINVEMISSGASEVAYYFIVRKKDLESAIRAVHHEFF